MTRTRIFCQNCRKYNATRESPITKATPTEDRKCSKCGAFELCNDGPVKGKFADVECGDKCEEVSGASCKCACGGMNHGMRA